MNYFTVFAALLKDRYAFLEEIHEGIQLKNKISALMLCSFISFAIYGAIIGSLHSPAQAIASAIKLPALYLITLIVCLPALYRSQMGSIVECDRVQIESDIGWRVYSHVVRHFVVSFS